MTTLPYPEVERGTAPEYDWFGKSHRNDYEWVIKHPTKSLYFQRLSGVFSKEVVWTRDLLRAQRFSAESNFMEEGPGTRAMRWFRKKECRCGWPIPVLLHVELIL